MGPTHRTLSSSTGSSGGCACGTHARANTATRRDTFVTPRGQERRRLEAVCMTHNNHRPTKHRAIFSDTPLRSCAASLPSMPLAMRRRNFALPQVAGRQPRVAAKRHHSTSPSMMPRRAPRAARRDASSVLSRLWLRSTMMTTMTRKWAAPVWGTS
jgi:hypothetical protein